MVRGSLLAAMLLVATPAWSHHVVSDLAVSGVEPRNVAELSVEAARFTLGDASGSWQVVAAAAEVAWRERLSLRVRVPLARIDRDDGESVTGLGDMELSAKVKLFAAPHGGTMVSAGLGIELPTGDEDEGLGGGHVELVPFASLAHERQAGAVTLMLALQAADRLALGAGGGHEGPHGSPISPHTAHELAALASAACAWGRLHASLGLEGTLVWDGGATELAARIGAGVKVARQVSLIAGMDLPVTEAERYQWRARLGAVVAF